MVSPSCTRGTPAGSSSSAKPPSGPTTTSDTPACSATPSGSATAAPSPAHTSCNAAKPTMLGNHTRRDCMAASRATTRSLRNCLSASDQRTTECCVGAKMMTSSMPISVSFCTAHSLRSPFTGVNATAQRTLGGALATTSPATSSAPSRHTQARHCPRPLLAVTDSPSRKRNTRPR